MKAIKVFVACLVLFLVQGFAYAKNIYVDGANTTGPWNGTLEYPYLRIQDGIKAAAVRDTVMVADGIYSGTGNVNLDFGGKGIGVKSLNGAAACIIDCGNVMYTRGFIFQSGETTGCLLEGFTIRNGAHDLGGAIHCKNASSPTISKCVIEDNEATSGGGISCLNDSNPIIAENAIRNNAADYGGGIYCSKASPTMTENSIDNNYAEQGGGVYYIAGSGGSTTLNVIMWNTAVYNGGGVYCDASSPTIENNNISENSGDWRGGGIAVVNGAFPIIAKNAINNNTDATWGGGIYCYKSGPKITENTIYKNTGGNGGGGLYIDQCTSKVLLIKGNFILENTGGDGGGIVCYASTGLVIDQNQINDNIANNNGGGIFCYKGSSPNITNNTVKNNSSTKNGGGIYCSDSAPLISGNTIESNTATKKGGGIFSLNKDNNAQILENIIKSNQADHGAGIFCYTSDPLIKGNTIESNSAIQAAGAIQCNSSSQPQIDSNIIKGNSCAAYGGSTIVCVQSSPKIVNNLIVGNSDNAFEGGTIYCGVSSWPTIISNTIAGNSTKWGGSAIYLTGSSATVENNILWNNSSPEIYFDDFGGPSFISIANSDVKGGQVNGIDMNNNGTMAWFFSNISADPLFVDASGGDYHLKLGSPCIGKGTMLSGTPNMDIENNPRPNPTGSNPDMGAYESPLSGLADISVAPSNWSFGNVALGNHSEKTFVVKNTGSGTLNVTATNLTGGSDFSFQSGGGSFSLIPGGTRNIVVRFAPASTGDQSATLSVINDVSGKSPVNVPLEGSGVPTPEPGIEAVPPSWNYGEVVVGSHADKSFVVLNPGSGVLQITATNLAADPDFSIVSGGGAFSLNPGEVREILIRFTPEQVAAREAILSLPNNAGGPVEILLGGTGVTEGVPAMDVFPESWDYGEVEVGLQVPRYFAVVNPGSGPLEVYETALTGDGDFQVSDGAAPFSLGPGAAWEILIAFTPSTDGIKSATLIVISNASGAGPREIPVQGHGVMPAKADIVVEPVSWNYGEVGIGLPSFQFVTVFNPGNDILEAQAPSVLGDSSFEILDGGGPFNLPPGAEWKILIGFQPLSVGQKNASLVIHSNVAGKSPIEVGLEGMGVENPVGDISVSPPGWGYGDVEVGIYAERIFVVTNPGSGTLEVTGTVLEGPPDFSIQDGGGAFLLGPGGVREVLVRFTPQSGGLKEATLNFMNNVEGKSPLVIPMEGNGLAPPEPGIEVSPSPYAYGDVTVGTHADRIFLVLNPGAGPLQVTSVDLTGSTDFTIEAGETGFTANPGGIGEILVRFAPQSEGPQSAVLRLFHNAPNTNPLEVPLAGNGVPPCLGDLDQDGDVDGKDLASFAAGGTGLTIEDVAVEFGRSDCF